MRVLDTVVPLGCFSHHTIGGMQGKHLVACWKIGFFVRMIHIKNYYTMHY